LVPCNPLERIVRKALLGPAWVILLGLVLAGARAQDRPAEAPGGQDAGARGGQAQSSSSRPAASRPRSAAPAPGTEARETDTAPPEEGDSTESPAANDAGVPPGGSVVDALRGRDLFHGNFCGAGSRLGAFDPTDELDAACKRHDECYDLNGRRSCGCDRTLRREALAIANNPQASREIRRRAGVVVQAAELMACEGP
jgi:hypothetical protein